MWVAGKIYSTYSSTLTCHLQRNDKTPVETNSLARRRAPTTSTTKRQFAQSLDDDDDAEGWTRLLNSRSSLHVVEDLLQYFHRLSLTM
eukprot:3548501-Amphidinium_carterae.1